jgi:hypothetical protein
MTALIPDARGRTSNLGNYHDRIPASAISIN